MREIRPSGLEGGVAAIRHPYPYFVPGKAGRWPAEPLTRRLTQACRAGLV